MYNILQKLFVFLPFLATSVYAGRNTHQNAYTERMKRRQAIFSENRTIMLERQNRLRHETEEERIVREEMEGLSITDKTESAYINLGWPSSCTTEKQLFWRPFCWYGLAQNLRRFNIGDLNKGKSCNIKTLGMGISEWNTEYKNWTGRTFSEHFPRLESLQINHSDCDFRLQASSFVSSLFRKNCVFGNLQDIALLKVRFSSMAGKALSRIKAPNLDSLILDTCDAPTALHLSKAQWKRLKKIHIVCSLRPAEPIASAFTKSNFYLARFYFVPNGSTALLKMRFDIQQGQQYGPIKQMLVLLEDAQCRKFWKDKIPELQ